MTTALLIKILDQRDKLIFARRHYKYDVQEEELKYLLQLLVELGETP